VPTNKGYAVFAFAVGALGGERDDVARFALPGCSSIQSVVCEAHTLVYHSTLGTRVMKKKKK